jgi:uncharacterized repeat protein (TIGR03803 family)
MRRSLLSPFIEVLGVLALALCLAASAAAGPKYKVLHSFASGKDGEAPYAPVVVDAKGNVYGTTGGGGAYNYGIAFELTPGHKGWAESVLYSFGATQDDGTNPQAGLTLDASGDLYGTTVNGGAYRYGTAFELTSGSNGWAETVLHSFCGSGDGCNPYSNLVFDGVGNLYGTTYNGWSNYGVAYELSPGSDGWTEALLYSFGGGNDGANPFAGLTWDRAGNLYGTTWMGGSYGQGTVYQLTFSGGSWTERVLYSFGASRHDGVSPFAGVIFDKSGNLYGATYVGGPNICFGEHECGIVYKLTPTKHGSWRETKVHDFAAGANGFSPSAVVMDAAGNLYGTTGFGGDPKCYCGTVFKLTPGAHGKWKYTVLHSFTGGLDGGAPNDPALDSKGNLYGTTMAGGKYGYGVVFELTP